MRRLTIVAVLLLLAPAADAAAGRTLGVYGDAGRFAHLTGQHSATKHYFPAWGRSRKGLDRAFREYGPVPMIAIQTKHRWGGGEVLTPRQISRGRGDRYLIRINRAAHAYGRRAYLRPFPEMNGHWSPYCAYNSNGTRRGHGHSQKALRKAFRRIYVILHGGRRREMNRVLRGSHMPGVRTSLPRNPQVRVIWNPQGFGSPNVPANMPRAYWPGRRFVDVVGDDLYRMSGGATWHAADRLYDAHPRKPFAFPEWSLWGMDDPGFIRRMRRFVKNHPRVELLSWYNAGAGSIFDLTTKPRSLAAYRRLIVPLG